MQLIRVKGGWMLACVSDEEIGTLYFASSDYASTLQRELATGTIWGAPVGEEDVEFLTEAAPKAERVWKAVQAACELRLEQEGLI